MENDLSKPLLTTIEPLNRVRVLNLNIFLRTPLVKNNASDYKDARTLYFSNNFMENYDIICFQEVFAALNSRRSKLIQSGLSKGLLYSAFAPSPGFWKPQIVDGGLLILSRNPIIETDFFWFGNGMMPDLVSLKGVLHAKILINNKVLHVFTLHLQATYPTASEANQKLYQQARKEQVQSVKKFINSKVEFNNEPFVLMGDFNIDSNSSEYESLQELLNEIKALDLIKNKYGKSPATYGVVLPSGEPEEVVLSHKHENKRNVSIDYIFLSENRGVSSDLADTRVEPFYVSSEPFTRISDHYGVQSTILL